MREAPPLLTDLFEEGVGGIELHLGCWAWEQEPEANLPGLRGVPEGGQPGIGLLLGSGVVAVEDLHSLSHLGGENPNVRHVAGSGQRGLGGGVRKMRRQRLGVP